MKGKEFNVRLESFYDFPVEESDYIKLDLELPAWIFINLEKKGIFDQEFLTMLGKSNHCDAYFLTEIIPIKDKYENERIQKIFDKYLGCVKDKKLIF